MNFKMSKMVIYKKDKDTGGLLFSLDDSSDTVLRVSGLVDTIAEKLYKGTDIKALKSSILAEYDVTEAKLDSDLLDFKKQLMELGYLEAE